MRKAARIHVHQLRSDVVVTLLGPPQVRRNGQLVPLRRRATTVAAMALLAERPVLRRSIAERLWPDSPEPGSNLRPVLTELRQHAGDLVDIGRSSISRAHGPVPPEVDVDLLEATVGSAVGPDPALVERVARLVSSPAGELLEGLDEPGNDALAEWLHWERQRVERLLTRARQLVLDERLRRGEIDPAISIAQVQAERHPYDEDANDQLVRLLLRSGRRTSAVQHADLYARRMHDDMGVSSPERLPALTADPPALDAGGSGGPLVETVPVPDGPLVGRHDELQAVRALVERSRLVNLTGPGGVGKTRLAIEVARELASRGARVVFVPLGDAGGGGSADVIAARMRLSLRPGEVGPQVAEYLAASQLVVVLDGCGEVREEVAEIVDRSLSSGHGVRFVATSRRPLGVLGEAIERIGPLPATGSTGARELFYDRAAMGGVPLDRDDRTVAAVDELCRRLDGLPLAIELAATLLGRRSLAEIIAQLDEPGAADAGAVGARLAAVVDSSVQLLSPQGRRLLSALGALVGSFDLEAAAAVGDLQPGAAAQLLDELTNHSLVLGDDGPHLGRYRLLNVVRARARHLAADGLAEATSRHASHFRHRCHRLELFDLRSQLRTDRMALDLANHTAAYEHLADRGCWQGAAEIAVGCYGVFATHGWTVRGKRWLERCLEHEHLLDRPTAELVRGDLVQLSLILDDVDGIERHAAALADAQDLRIRAEATGTRALPLMRTDLDRARALVADALRAATAADVPGAMVWPRGYLAFQRMYEGRLADAVELLDESIAEARQLGHTGHLWILEDAAASCLLMLGRPGSVIERLEGGERAATMWDARLLLIGLARLELGDVAAGREAILRFAEPADRRRLPRSANDAIVGLAHLAAATGDADRALHLLGTTGPGRMPVSIGLGRRLAATLGGTERVAALRAALEARGQLHASADATLEREWRRAMSSPAAASRRG